MMKMVNHRIFSGIGLVHFILCMLSVSLPILLPSWHGKLIVVLLFFWLMAFPQIRLRILLTNVFVLLAISMVTLYILGNIYSKNLTQSKNVIESLAPIALFSIAIFSLKDNFNGHRLMAILICFVVGVLLLNLMSLTFISKSLWDPVHLQSNIIIANSHIVQIHPAFLSLYISFSVFFLIEQFFPVQMHNRKKLGWTLFSLVILIAFLIWINSRTGILCFLIAALFYSTYSYKRHNKIFMIALIVFVVANIFALPFSRERFYKAPMQVLSFGSSEASDPNKYPIVARKQAINCSIELLKGPEFFYGYGTGDFRDILKACYEAKGYTLAYEKDLDSHNEYLAQLHRHGIIGLTLFLGLLILPFLHALKYRSPLLAVFVILFATTALFETVLSSQKSATFYALFCPLLMVFAQKKYEESNLNKA